MLKFFYNLRKNKKGFTLIELIVVIAILAILALLAIPRLSGFSESAKQAADKEAAAVVANAAAMYHATNPTDDEITTQDLTDANLIEDSDLVTQSQAFEDDIDDDAISLVDDVVSVTLTVTEGHGVDEDYVISK